MAYEAAQAALQQATLYTDDYLYRFIKLPPNAITAAAGIVAEAGNPFTAMLVDKDEVTLMLEQEDYEEYNRRLIDHTVSDISYRLITFDIELAPDLIGFMAYVSAALAKETISIMPFAAFSRDHIFVPADDYERAIITLKNLQTSTSPTEDNS